MNSGSDRSSSLCSAQRLVVDDFSEEDEKEKGGQEQEDVPHLGSQ